MITLETHPEVNFRFSYTGRELDAETGLYNYRTRYYDPAVGEFVSEDTIGFAGGDVNLSRYVANSPVNYIDPFGFSGFCRVGSLDDQSTLVANDTTGEPGVDIGDLLKGAAALIVGGIVAAIETISSILEEDSDDDEDERRELYRGDSREPNEIFESGFQPKGTNTDLERYVQYNNSDTIYVGTSKDFDVAAKYATKYSKYQRQPGLVYVIKDPGGGIDVNAYYESIGKDNKYKRDQEVVFPGGISTQDIRGVIPVDVNMQPSGPEIPNPYFIGR